MKNLQSLVNKENIEKLGNELRNLTQTIMETVAPPISEHEVVEVWLSHDMVGYSGLEALVYRSFARIMEYTETGQVIVRGTSEKSTANEAPNVQELNMCEGLVEGTKLTKANIDHLVKTYYTPPKSGTTFTPQSGAVPVINCPVFMAIQPVKYAMPSWGNDSGEDDEETHQLVYLILLYDPTHQLKFKTLSQTMPLSWLDVPYEENEWIEDKMVETLQMAVRTIAQDYVWTRMTGGHQAMQATANEVNKSSETQEASLKTEKEP
ncbi:maintenance of telomere capping protein 1 [Radiomyces spectabilis]|uniref:maintenance of telomere capping protein 1 n=1 Tax=Radiomyces spectabilis TaxID=64574 RepID=UPI002220CE6E|nr:maintenance of telomere capping protein 1 [Radiomyces spectabilis]KAI8390940.1 maintenance of telomere capping protein 1 [Radiomyces spectabilis]